MGAAAEAAGLRERGPSVLERRQQEAAAEAAAEAAEAERRASRRRGTSKVSRVLESTTVGDAVDGVRGRVRLHALSSVQPTLEIDDGRRKSLAQKSWARRSVVVHSVGPCGGANLESLPGREEFGAGEGEAWLEAAVQFVDDNFADQGGEVRSMDQRDRKVGLFGDFCERAGHGKFVQWVADAEHGGLYKLEPVTQAVEGEMGAQPLVPSWGAVMEYSIKSAVGHPSTPKGGTAEYRNGPWYKTLRGKRQGDRMGEEKAYGHGPYADRKTRFTTIEQNVSAIRKFFDEVLKDTKIANPARNARLLKVMKTLARKCSRARLYSPEVLAAEYVRAAFECVDWDDTEEVTTLFYMAKDLVMGRRAADELMLDWDKNDSILP